MPGKKSKIESLRKETEKPDFWKDQDKAKSVQKEISELEKEIKTQSDFETEAQDLIELLDLMEKSRRPEGVGVPTEASGKTDEKILKDISDKFLSLEARFKKHELKIFLGGKYDKNNALLTISAGVGGRDAQDWASMLFRMYSRYCESKGWDISVLHESLGEEGGIKSTTLEVRGYYAYGYLKNEAGVHRLVRISPFSPNKLRHTSFAALEVLPEIDAKDIEIKPDDLRVDTFRSSGAGGQNVNKRETAVRVTHIPTGIAVAVQTERSQQQNKEKAMQVLASKLHALQLKKEEEELAKTKKIKKSAEWGAQIRSYVLHPYQMVKDHRTNYETSQIQKVLDGNLDEFIEAELKS
ncbi:MAG: Peptide chain release factor 2 [Candidatus Azambacteria bacterium GW2011_GWA2_39_10]|uniref:Peptide chain release factor 2 n=1 Tax=Candidatus Azambacteria bacterium GW2011_GWA2_39_10 TaxID=1618611 RepID=A0A0G0LM14_9BACT|nr:MAG: Peptide chain release factor 2 [Candidatus Azambacteria bacterium GW2011_GWA2_39_10]